MTAKRRTALSPADRDRAAYALARAYLLGFGRQGVNDKLLEHYVSPRRNGATATTMSAIFHRLLMSARNRNMMASVIPEPFVNSLGPLLSGFTPAKVIDRFGSADELLDAMEALRPSGKLRRSSGSLWPLFARSTLSGARFLNQFSNGPDFLAWVQAFDDDPRKRAALPLLISKEIEGFGFALACDFLKELGFVNFAKPDVHVNAIVKGLSLVADSASDYTVFKAVARIARHCDTTPYDIDKIFWLVGSGRFYDHAKIGRDGRIATDRDQFIRDASKKLGTPAT